MTTQFEGALGWDSVIEQESNFTLLEPGVYNFVVTKMERGTYQPSSNSSIQDVSPRAELEIKVTDDKGNSTNVFENLILHSKMEWKLSQFFISIGQKQPGQPLNPNWSQVVGSSGRCEIEVNKYKDKSGNDRENNRVKEFLKPTQGVQPPQQFQQQPTQPAQPMQQQPQNPTFDFS